MLLESVVEEKKPSLTAVSNPPHGLYESLPESISEPLVIDERAVANTSIDFEKALATFQAKQTMLASLQLEDFKLETSKTIPPNELLYMKEKVQTFETPQACLQRLQRETAELLSFTLHWAKKAPRDTNVSELLGYEPSFLIDELKNVQSFLDQVAHSPEMMATTSPDALAKLSSQKEQLTGQALYQQMGELIQQLNIKSDDLPYVEFEFVGEIPPQSEEAAILLVEKRIARLEQWLGIEKGVLPNLPAGSLSSAIEDICSNLMTYRPSYVEALEKRSSAIINTMHQAAPTIQNQEIIEQTYQFLVTTRPIAGALPQIVKRLRALKILHQDAGQCITRLRELEEQQQHIEEMLMTAEKDFTEFKTGLSENLKLVQNLLSSEMSSE